ncbi:MAG: hypothetical protein K2J78_01125, partial [Muribaculaceae bacterium]|nr:hypothetical protein [Muribaculaceae bacterium]
IKIKIGIEDTRLVGTVSNTFNDSKQQQSTDSSESGVDLEKLRIQKKHLYPDSHTFTIDKTSNAIDQAPNIFIATISIALTSLKIPASNNQ